MKCHVVFVGESPIVRAFKSTEDLLAYANNKGRAHIMWTACSYWKCRAVRKARREGKIVIIPTGPNGGFFFKQC